MIKIFRTIDGHIHQLNEASEGCWVVLANPTATEILETANKYHIDQDDLRAPLDEEERSRIEVEDNYTLILVDIPVIEERNEKDWTFGTVPLGIIISEDMIFTGCLEETPGSAMLHGWESPESLYLQQHVLYPAESFTGMPACTCITSVFWIKKVRSWSRNHFTVHRRIRESSSSFWRCRNLSGIFHYLPPGERGGAGEASERWKVPKKYPEDTDLLEDVMTENKQAIEMARVYTGILNSMMDTFSSVISNNVNGVMKFLTTITIVMAIPTMVFSAYGMNLNLSGIPFSVSHDGFLIVILTLSGFKSCGGADLSSKKDLF